MSKIQENINWKPEIYNKFDNDDNQLYYEKSWFCDYNKTIHQSIKNYINCTYCVTEEERLKFSTKKDKNS